MVSPLCESVIHSRWSRGMWGEAAGIDGDADSVSDPGLPSGQRAGGPDLAAGRPSGATTPLAPAAARRLARPTLERGGRRRIVEPLIHVVEPLESWSAITRLLLLLRRRDRVPQRPRGRRRRPRSPGWFSPRPARAAA